MRDPFKTDARHWAEVEKEKLARQFEHLPEPELDVRWVNGIFRFMEILAVVGIIALVGHVFQVAYKAIF